MTAITLQPASVVDIRDVDQSAPDVVYVGSTSAFRSLPQSPYANPFKAVNSSAAEHQRVLREYRQWFHAPEQASLREMAMRELAGKKLATFLKLKDGESHADVLAAFVNGDSDYETALEKAIELRKEREAKQWEIGDVANDLFGDGLSIWYANYNNMAPEQKTLKEFADAVGPRPSTISEWKSVSAFYPKFARAKLQDKYPNLNYSHFRRAWRQHKDSYDDALNLLERASFHNWTIAEMDRTLSQEAGKPTPQPITVNDLVRMLGGDTVLLMKDCATKTVWELGKAAPGAMKPPAGLAVVGV